MLKENIKNEIEKLAPNPFRQNTDEVAEILNELNINKQSCFAQLYLTYTGPFDPIFQDVEILEITDILSPNIIEMTEYFREHFLLPQRYIALSDDASYFSEGLALVMKDDKYGYINDKNETVLPFIYDDGALFENGKAWVQIGDKQFEINKLGIEIK